MFAGAAPLPAGGAHGSAGLSGEDDLVALTLQPAPDDLLGASTLTSHGVDVGGIEEGDACIDGGVHDLLGNRFVGLMTERRGAEAQSRNGETGGPESRVLHPIPPRTAFHRAASASNRGGRAHVPGRAGTQLLLRFRPELRYCGIRARHAAVVGDLAVLDPHRIDGVERDRPAGRRDAEKRSLVGCLWGRYQTG